MHRVATILRVGLAALLLSAAIWQCWADHLQSRGDSALKRLAFLEAAEFYNRSARLNSWDIEYTRQQIDALWAVIPLLNPASRVAAAEISILVAGRACRFHRNDPLAHELLALSFLVKGDIEGLNTIASADEELVIAESLAPNCTAYEKRRASLAGK